MRSGSLIGICLTLLLAASPAFAETSSWSTDTQPRKPAAKSKPMAKPQPKGPKPLQPSQAADPVSKLAPAAPAGGLSRYLAPATGQEAAYIAFEQGQYLTALDLAERAANKGDPQAHTLVARIYAEGLGVPKDEAQALYWLRNAAERKQPEAEYLLAIVHRHGWLGAPRNPKLSLHLLQRSALQDHAAAQFELGLAYIDGRIVKRDPQEAYGWLSRAARQGHARAAEYVRRIDTRLKAERPQ